VNLTLGILKERINHISIFLIVIPLILSAFTHLFNPVGFPCVQYDEGVYMRRAMYALQGLGPQDPASRFDHGQDSTSSYDHPYFGQIFLAGVLDLIGYPKSVHPSSVDGNVAVHSIEMLYLVPRVLMGILAVVDTFLVYKISERRYNRNVAVIASVLFAVMPLSWLNRWILLDTILMPFLLSSILFALYTKRSSKNSNNDKNKSFILILLSGIFLGLAIYTKIPAFTMIPLVGFLVYTNNNRNLKTLGLWFIPVILIPIMWPAYSVSVGHFDEWVHGVLWQGTGRQASVSQGKENHQILGSIAIILSMDPVLVVLAIAGVIFAVLKRDFFLLLWIMPFLIFMYLIGWISYFHYVLVLPIFCISAATLIEDLSKKIMAKKIHQTLFSFAIISAIGIFGLIIIEILITTNFFLSQFQAAAYATWKVQANDVHHAAGNNNNIENNNNDVTIISGPIYSWIFKYAFGNDHVFNTRDSSQPIQTKKVLLMVDNTYTHVLSKSEVEDEKQIERLQKISNSTDTVATFVDTGVHYNIRQFPYNNMKDCPLLSSIEIKTNY
jgi:hypothetical protein